MSENALKTNFEVPAEPNIINYYGLKANPLESEDPFYFLTSHLKKSLQLFNYLTSFSHKIIVTTAPQGSGKTAFLEQFVKNQSDEKIICKIMALKFDTPSQLLHEVADQLDLNVKDDISPANLIASIQAFAMKVADEERTVIVIIEEAHVFNDSVIEAVYQLVQPKPGLKGAIKLILSGEQALEDKNLVGIIKHISAENKGKHELFFHVLPPFTLEECKQYLQACFDRQGDLDKIPFSEDDYIRVHKNSQGLPQKVNAQAIEIMEEGVSRLIAEKDGSRWLLAAAVAICLVAGVLITTYLWQDKLSPEVTRVETINNPVEILNNQVETLNNRTPSSLLLGTIHREPVMQEDVFKIDNNQPMLQPASLISVLEEDQVKTIPDVNTALTEPAKADPEPARTSPPKTESQLEPSEPTLEETNKPALTKSLSENEKTGITELKNDSAQQAPDENKADETIEKATDIPPMAAQTPSEQMDKKENISPYTEHEQAIMATKGSDYTMQMLGSHQKKRILHFMKSYPDAPQIRHFETVNKGKPWYVAIIGQYQNYAEASAAADNLPQVLKDQKPWIRRFSGIQKAIKSRSGNQ